MKRVVTTRGVSIIEFFVVISILILLSGVLMFAFRDPKKAARDARRLTDVKDFAKAVELYSSDNKAYPMALALTAITGKDTVTTMLTGSGILQKPIVDPLMPMYEYRYQTNSTASNYYIQFCLETDRMEGYAVGCGNVYRP